MKFKQDPELRLRLTQEAAHPDTIFLHKRGNDWAAYGNSAILLQQFFTPVWLQMGVVGTEKIPYVICDGTISPRKSSEVRVFEVFSEDPDWMTIRCPDADLQKTGVSTLTRTKS